MATNFSTLPTTFDDIKIYLADEIGKRYPFLGVLLNNTFLIIFIDIVAYAIEILMDYSSNIFNELHLPTAQQFENIRIKAQFFGYKAHRPISAEGTIKVGLDENYDTYPTDNIIITEGNTLTINGIDFLVKETTVFTPTDLYKQVPVIQGRAQVVSNTAEGIQSETYTINDFFIENDNLEVYVNSVLYTEVDSFFKSTSTDTHYTVDPLTNMTGVTITFGDGFRGKKLTAGDSVELRYIQTDALNGQIKSVGFEVTFLDTYTYPDTTEVELYAINDSKLDGASSVESSENLKYYGQLATSATEDTAFNDAEIKLALQDLGGVLISRAVSEFDVSPLTPDYTKANRINLLVVPTGGETLNDTRKQEIRSFLRPKMDFTDFIEFTDPEYIDIQYALDFDVGNNTPQNFHSLVDEFLAAQYPLGELDLGESLNHSVVVSSLSDEFSDYIKRFKLVLKVVEEEDDVALQTGGGGSLEKTLLLGDLLSSGDSITSCRIEVEFTLDGETTTTEEAFLSTSGGSFQKEGATASEFLTSGTIDFETGEIVLILKDEVEDLNNIRYIYIPNDTDGMELNIDIKTQQIIRYKETAGLNGGAMAVEYEQ